MENKYFTPDIEDIRVGYECEVESNSKWKHITVTAIDSEENSIGTDNGGYWLTAQNLRVPYLTKEQIEAEGWEYNINYESIEFIGEDLGFLKEYPDNKTQAMCYYNPKTKSLRVEWIYDCAGMGWLYKGSCKDINTFRLILKLLHI